METRNLKHKEKNKEYRESIRDRLANYLIKKKINCVRFEGITGFPYHRSIVYVNRNGIPNQENAERLEAILNGLENE
jgi:hypothetical protein